MTEGTNTIDGEITQTSDDEQQRNILERLNVIRVGKSKILNMLAMLKQNEDQVTDRELMQRLVESYDNLKHQEEKFIILISRIANFTDSNKDAVNVDEGSDHIDVDAKLLTCDEDDELDVAQRELRSAATDSVLASSVHDSLKNNIRLTQEKLAAMKLLYEKNLAERNKAANVAVECRELAQLQLSQERGELDRKQKLLERLRKKAAAKLLTSNGGATNEVPNDESAKLETEYTLKFDERVPPVPEMPKLEPAEATDTLLEASQRDDFTQDPLRAHISARFSAFEARKQKMRELRSQLNRIERRKMDNAYSDALGRLQNLTEMRQQLEGLASNINNDSDNVTNVNITPPKIDELMNAENVKSPPASPKSDGSDLSTATDEEKTVTPGATIPTQQPSTTIAAVKAETVKTITIQKLNATTVLPEGFTSSETAAKTRENLPLQNTFYQAELPESGNNFSNNALEFTVRRIVDTTRNWIEKQAPDGLSAECAIQLCDFVARESGAAFVGLANLQHRSDKNLEENRERFLSQLTPLLDELVEPMVGVASASADATALVDAFLNALSNALRNDLAFWTLLRTADALISQAENN